MRSNIHGIPFLVKDNIASKDKMQTTAGSAVLIGTTVPADARVLALLRAAGGVLLGKANLSEWASMRASYYAEAYSSRGGQNRNPYNLAEHPGGIEVEIGSHVLFDDAPKRIPHTRVSRSTYNSSPRNVGMTQSPTQYRLLRTHFEIVVPSLIT